MADNRRPRNNDNYNQDMRRNQRPNRDYDDYPPQQRNNEPDYDDYNDRAPRRPRYDDNRQYYNNQPPHSNKALIIGLLVAGGIAAAAGLAYVLKGNENVQITSVSPNIVTSQQPYQSCHKVGTTTYVKNQKDGTEGALIGGATGAVAGGIIGNQIRHGGGGTAIGAVVGGATGALAGSAIQKSNQPDYIAKKGSSNQCHTAYKTVQAQNGYKVQYVYKDTPGMVITQNAPAVGSKIPLDQLRAMAIQTNGQGN